MFGTLADFDALVAEAHRLGLKVIIDQVLSHTSDQHPWFMESRPSRDNPKADWYVWADPKPDGTAPNNWLSIFGGPAWEWDGVRRQYYMHNFLTSQPDLNFHNPEVQDALLETVRFWLERGVDGFRLDTVNYYFHDQQLRDNPPLPRMPPARRCAGHQSLRLPAPSLRQDAAGKPRFPAGASARCSTSTARARRSARSATAAARCRRSPPIPAGGDKLNMCYTFDLLGAGFLGRAYPRLRRGLREGGHRRLGLLGLLQPRRGAPCQPLDAGRAMTRTHVAKLAIALLSPLRGSICLYQGEELGLAGGRTRLRGSARSLRHPLLAGLQGPRRMPHADGLGSGAAECRLLRPASRGCRCRRRIARRAVDCPGRRRAARCWRTIARCWPSGSRIRRWSRAISSSSHERGRLLAFIRKRARRLLFVFNFADEPADFAVPAELAQLQMLKASGQGARIEGMAVMLDPMSSCFAQLG